jgi:putative adhesin
MPVFDTPDPISVIIDRIVGDVRIVASDRTDTSVDVRPADHSKPADLRGAEKALVEYSPGRLVIKGPKQPNFIGKVERIDVTIELPTGSRVDCDLDMGSITSDGRLGDVRLKSGMGEMHLGGTKDLQIRGSYGKLTVDRVDGDADISTGKEIRIGHIAGMGMIKNSNGSTRVGQAGGDLYVKAANGDIDIDRTGGNVTAKTANGSIRVGEVAGGAVVLETAAGDVRVAIRQGVPAYLDVATQYGNVVNTLDPADSPKQSETAVELRARTAYGDIVISRSSAGKEEDV